MPFFLLMMAVAIYLSVKIFLSVRQKRERLKGLFREKNLVIKKEDGKIEYPKYKITKNKLILKKYNSSFTSKDADSRFLIAVGKVLNCDYIFAEYEKATRWERFIKGENDHHLVLYNANLQQTDFFKNRPILKDRYSFWVGKDIKGSDAVYSIENRQGIALTGQAGLGKTSLANVILWGLDLKSKEEFIFTKSKADFFHTRGKTFSFYKDDEEKMLEVLRELKLKAITEQQNLDRKGLKNIYEEQGKMTLIVFDEAHSYLKHSTSLPKEQKAVRAEIIEIVNWMLRQARSVGYICIFIMPNPEKDQIDINIRDVAYFFSSKISSEQVSHNIFSSPIANLIPSQRGLFVGTDGAETKVFQVPNIYWKKDE